jgi:hypothetical protein
MFEKYSASSALLKPGFIWSQVFFSPDGSGILFILNSFQDKKI